MKKNNNTKWDKEPSWDQIGKAIGTKIEKKCKSKNFSKDKVKEHVCKHKCDSAIYGLGFIGALIYYISTATSFWIGVLGVLKAIIWPVFVVYSLMKSLGL
jgi:hypothetical protein